MLKTSSSTDAKASQGGTLVVLLAPEALGPHVDPEALSRTLRSAKPARVLIHLVNVDGLPLAAVVEQALVAEQADVQTEWLLGPNVSPLSPSTARLAQMPPGSTTEEQEELALALADVVLVSPALEQTRLFQRAHTLGKTFVSVGAALPEWKPKPSITQCLDPDGPGWLAYWRCVFGRWEQLLLELLAINWLGCNIGGIAEVVSGYGGAAKCLAGVRVHILRPMLGESSVQTRRPSRQVPRSAPSSKPWTVVPYMAPISTAI